MAIFAFIFTPHFFIGLFVVLTTLSVVAALYGLEYDRRHKKLKMQLKDGQALNLQLFEKAGKLEQELSRLKEDLAVKSQMYDGLKEQYSELEKDFDKINSQSP